MAPCYRPMIASSYTGLAERRSPERYVWLIGFLAALVMASEAGAEALFPGQKYPAGNAPRSVAVADLDGDSDRDLVTANGTSEH
jgi:hypothetical protein